MFAPQGRLAVELSTQSNAHVKRSHRTHNKELYQVQADSAELARLNQQLRRWEPHL